MKKVAILLSVSMLLAGCLMGPNYRRPELRQPDNFRGAEPTADVTSLADMKWAELFQDSALTNLVHSGLEQNHDIRAAAERVLQARAQFRITRSQLAPTLNFDAGFSSNRNSQVGAIPFLPAGASSDVSYTQLGFSLGWELDVWGRVRRLKESELARYLATEEAAHGITTTVIADITGAYLVLRELDMELEIAEKTREIGVDSLRLTNLRRQQGVASALDVYQAEQFLRSATARIAASERAIAQAENALSVLAGRNPGDIARGKTLDDLMPPADVPPGLPSTLLARRPDIREAENSLIAANAQIGAVRAQYFPQITLTGFMGGQTRALTDLFTGPARQWTFSPLTSLPIFNAGRLRANVKVAESVQREALVRYEQAVQTAFREVSDALVGFSKTSEQLEQQHLLVNALRESNRLSLIRYQGGLDSYLQVLDAERNLFQGELVEAQLRRDVLLTVVELYRALGGGWQ
jgi:NodT family efflux transporter outer membrane factor (OMF) lipoprotein